MTPLSYLKRMVRIRLSRDLVSMPHATRAGWVGMFARECGVGRDEARRFLDDCGTVERRTRLGDRAVRRLDWPGLGELMLRFGWRVEDGKGAR